MSSVEKWLQEKHPRPYLSAAPTDTVAAALRILADSDAGALLVIENDRIVGLFSERDYARKVLLQGRSSLTTPLYEVMSHTVFYVGPEYSLEECLTIMAKLKIRHLPVLQDQKVVGMLNWLDVTSALIEDKQFFITELLRYINSSYIPEAPAIQFQPAKQLITLQSATF